MRLCQRRHRKSDHSGDPGAEVAARRGDRQGHLGRGMNAGVSDGAGTRKTRISRMLAPLALLTGSLMLGLASGAAAQDDAWPQRAVRMIAPAAPGGNPDVMGRLLADKFTAAFGKPFI